MIAGIIVLTCLSAFFQLQEWTRLFRVCGHCWYWGAFYGIGGLLWYQGVVPDFGMEYVMVAVPFATMMAVLPSMSRQYQWLQWAMGIASLGVVGSVVWAAYNPAMADPMAWGLMGIVTGYYGSVLGTLVAKPVLVMPTEKHPFMWHIACNALGYVIMQVMAYGVAIESIAEVIIVVAVANALVVIPHFRNTPLYFYHLYGRSIITGVGIIVWWAVAWSLHHILERYASIVVYTVSSIAILVIGAVGLYVRKQWLIKGEDIPFFSVINTSVMYQAIQQLMSTIDMDTIQRYIDSNPLFKNENYDIVIWKNNRGKFDPFVNADDVFDDDLVFFLQYVKHFNRHQFGLVARQYERGALRERIYKLMTFMQDNHIVELRLVEYGDEVMGVVGIVSAQSRLEMREVDKRAIHVFMNSLGYSFYNTNTVNALYQHQQTVHIINESIAALSVNDSIDHIVSKFRSMLQDLLPETMYFLFLHYRSESDGYHADHYLNYFFSQINSVVASGLKKFVSENVITIFNDTDSYMPSDIQAFMMQIGSRQVVLIRINDGLNSPIMVIFLKANVDVVDYRLGYCHHFLQQFLNFFDYRNEYMNVFEVTRSLVTMLQQLPVAIMSVNKKTVVDFLNPCMRQTMRHYVPDEMVAEGVAIDLDQFPHEIGRAIQYVQNTRLPVNNRITLRKTTRKELYQIMVVPLIKDFDAHFIVTLVDIQGSRDLADEMRQNNRLILLSKLSKNVSNQLMNPVQTLIKGVRSMDASWQDPAFRTYFDRILTPQVDRINVLCQALLRLSRSNGRTITTVHLPTVIEDAVGLIVGELSTSKCRCHIQHVADRMVSIDRIMILQILTSILLVAIERIAHHRLHIQLHVMVSDNNQLVADIVLVGCTDSNDGFDANSHAQVELSIINELVMNQNGTFNRYMDETGLKFSVIIPLEEAPYDGSSNV